MTSCLMQTKSSTGQLPQMGTAFIPKEDGKALTPRPRTPKAKAKVKSLIVVSDGELTAAEEQERLHNLNAIRTVLKYKGNWGSLSTKSSVYRVPPTSPRKPMSDEDEKERTDEIPFAEVVFKSVAANVGLPVLTKSNSSASTG